MNNVDFDILVAKCGRAIGLKGEVKLIIYTDFIEIFKKGNVFRCGDSMLRLDSFNPHKNSAKFSEINTQDEAKTLNSRNLYSSKNLTKQYCKLKKDEFFWFDIIGLDVYENELLLGCVDSIERISNTDYLVVNVDKNIGGMKKKSFLIPYISRYIIDVSLESRAIYVKDSFVLLENS